MALHGSGMRRDTHTAEAEFTGVRTLWQRETPPHGILPPCQCGVTPLVPIVFHDPGATQSPWSGTWVCMRCGVWDSAALGEPATAESLVLAADRLSRDEWTEVCSRAADFWIAVRDRVAGRVLNSTIGGDWDCFSGGPPTHLAGQRNSPIYVPLLLDASHLLAEPAQRAWRAHDLASSNWERWVQTLRVAQQVSMTALVAQLEGKMRAAARIDDLTKDVCLLWHCAQHAGGIGASVPLADLTRASGTSRGYLPGLVQEVLLEAFGGQQLAQSVALLAAAWRARSGGGTGNATSISAAGAPAAPTRHAGASPAVNGFVRGANLVTGYGWNRAVAAASEANDVPVATEPTETATGTASETSNAPQGPCDPAQLGNNANVTHFDMAVEDDDALVSTGLTQDVQGMDVESQLADALRAPQPAAPPQAPSAVVSEGAQWSIAAPRSRHTAVCVTCCSDIAPRLPRVRRGHRFARAHHVGCVALQCGAVERLSGWDSLDDNAKTIAQTQYDSAVEACPRAPPGAGPTQGEPAEMDAEPSRDSVHHVVPESVTDDLRNMNFWNSIPWSALHDSVRSFDVIPPAAKPAIADFRQKIATEIAAHEGCADEELYLKALFFSDRLLFSSSKRSRGGARGQKGETLARTIARRLRTAWSGQWGALWEESNAAMRRGAGAAPSEAQKLARQVKAIEEALADEDVREALRCVEGQVKLAPDGKARRCLPGLFPQQQARAPVLPQREPLAEDIDRFMRELQNAYAHAPRHRAPGPGGSRSEHWAWMPGFEEAWEPMQRVLLRFALCKLPETTMQALHGARVLAGDRPEDDKVRPFALGVVHRRLTSKAVGKTFQARVSAAVSPVEYSLGSKCGAELMHKTVLIDLDSREGAAKFSFDASNAHNEFERCAAAESVVREVPDMVPWVRGCLLLTAVHVHTGNDGEQTALHKTRGGDQGDALTALVFPLTYKRVSTAVGAAAAAADPHARIYTYQDDLDTVCKPDAYAGANAAYASQCQSIGLRANASKNTASPGRGTSVESLPRGVTVEPRAVVLRHGECTPVPALPANSASDGSQLAEGSPEMRDLTSKRNQFYHTLRRLRAAGLPALASAALLRTRTAGDHVFISRACGIPPTEAAQLDARLCSEVEATIGPGADLLAQKRVFLRARDGGLGFQSVFLASPAAYAASWHACMPAILKRLDLPAASALEAISPWARACLPVATRALRTALADESISIGDEGVPASQRILAKAPLAAAALEVAVEAARDTRTAATLRSSGGVGAGVWLNAPTQPNQHLSNAQLTISLRTRLHLALPQCQGECQHRRRNGTVCGAPLDEKGFHARCCAVGGWLVKRHDAACAALGAWCEEMGCHLEPGQKPWGEVLVPWAAPARAEARMDLVVRVPGVSTPYYIDLTVVSAISMEALAAGSATRDGAAATTAALGKMRDYPNCAVTPFVVEDHGRLGDDALKFIRVVAPVDPVERSAAIRRLHQSIGATLQRCSADAVIAATTVRPR